MLTVGNSRPSSEELLGNGLLSCPGLRRAAGRAGSRGPRRVSGRADPGERCVRGGRGAPLRGTHVLLPAWLLARRWDGTAVIGDMLARAAQGRGSGRSRRRRGCRRTRCRPAAAVPRLGGPGAGVLHAAGRGAGGGSGAAGPGGRVAGGCGGGGRRGGRGGGGGWQALTVSGWELAAVVTAGSLLSPAVAFRAVRGACPVCPGVTVQRELPSDPGRCFLSLSAACGGRRREGTEVTTADEADRRRGWSRPGRRACSGTRWCRSSWSRG